MSLILKGCNFEHTKLSFISNPSMMIRNRERSKGRKFVESGIKTNVC